ncbi:hypothetical protein [Endothiovibrio diazotrophicus]
MQVAVAQPELNTLSAGLRAAVSPVDDARSGGESTRTARRSGERGEAAADGRGGRRRSAGQLVPRTQTALYTSQARRGIAVYRDTAGFTGYSFNAAGGGIDLYA